MCGHLYRKSRGKQSKAMEHPHNEDVRQQGAARPVRGPSCDCTPLGVLQPPLLPGCSAMPAAGSDQRATYCPLVAPTTLPPWPVRLICRAQPQSPRSHQQMPNPFWKFVARPQFAVWNASVL